MMKMDVYGGVGGIGRVALLVVGVGLIACVAYAQDDVLSRVVEPDTLGPPIVWAPDAIDSGLWMKRVAHGAQVPVIFEAAPRGPGGGAVSLVRIDLSGSTVREALDRLVDEDPRYSWQVLQGAVVVRPAAAWTDQNHPFNGSAGTQAGDDAPLSEALREAVSGEPLPATLMELAGRADQGRRVARSTEPGLTVVARVSALAAAGGWFVQMRDPRMTREPAIEITTMEALGYIVTVAPPSQEVGQ